jgi:hypothetical protein
MIRRPAPERPKEIDPLAEAILARLQTQPVARFIVLGGYFALKHYHDYRNTHDIDAWWADDSRESDREQVRGALKAAIEPVAAERELTLNQRRFGDTESWELLKAGAKVFSFQIASRTLRLEPPVPSPWPPLLIETFADNVASKMNALVQRGAPRDFTDIRQLVTAGHLTPEECWDLWRRKNPDVNPGDARLEVGRHLHELELRRPLETLTDSAQREQARQTRAWFRTVFLRPPPT